MLTGVKMDAGWPERRASTADERPLMKMESRCKDVDENIASRSANRFIFSLEYHCVANIIEILLRKILRYIFLFHNIR